MFFLFPNFLKYLLLNGILPATISFGSLCILKIEIILCATDFAVFPCNILIYIITSNNPLLEHSHYYTDRSKVVLLLWVIFVIYVLCMSCFLVCSMQHCGHLLGKGWPLGFLVCSVLLCFVTFPCGIVGLVWCLIVSISDICLLTQIKKNVTFCQGRSGIYCCIRVSF